MIVAILAGPKRFLVVVAGLADDIFSPNVSSIKLAV
jgi:hypothetical protein